MKRRGSKTPSNADSIASAADAKDAGGPPHVKNVPVHGRELWAPLVMYLGPCFSEKKVYFSMPMEHIACRENPALYESIPLESALQVWTYVAHEGTIKELKQKIVYGTSILARLNSDACAELRLCSLYFSQKMTKKELKQQISKVFNDTELYDSFTEALRRMQMEKIYIQMNPTLQLFIPEAQATANLTSKKKLKWALKYNPDVVSYDEGNMNISAASATASPSDGAAQQGAGGAAGYDVGEALMYACKYNRKVRIARWGAEIPDLPLSELIFRALVHFLHSGCYVDCRLIAQSHSLAESRALNALHQQATAEDFAFHYGYVLDQEGYVTKFSSSAPSSSAVSSAVTMVMAPSRFSFWGLFRRKKYAAQHPPAQTVTPPLSPTTPTTPSGSGSLSPSGKESAKAVAGMPPVAPRRGSGLLYALSDPAGGGNPNSALAPEHQALARQLEQELGCAGPESERQRRFTCGTTTTGTTEAAEEAALIAAVAARNAAKKRTPTNWKAFLNHKYDSTAAAKGGYNINSINNSSNNNLSGKAASKGPVYPLHRESSTSTNNSGNGSTQRKSIFEMRREEAQRLGGETGSYTYGLGKDGLPVGDAGSLPGISTADVKASKAAATAGAKGVGQPQQVRTALEETIAVKRISCLNLLTVVRTNATSLCEEDVELPRYPDEAPAPDSLPRLAVVVVAEGEGADSREAGPSLGEVPTSGVASAQGASVAPAGPSGSPVLTSHKPKQQQPQQQQQTVPTCRPTKPRSEAKSSDSDSSQSESGVQPPSQVTSPPRPRLLVRNQTSSTYTRTTQDSSRSLYASSGNNSTHSSSIRLTAEEADAEERARYDSADRVRFDSSGSISGAVQALLAMSKDSDSGEEDELGNGNGTRQRQSQSQVSAVGIAEVEVAATDRSAVDRSAVDRSPVVTAESLARTLAEKKHSTSTLSTLSLSARGSFSGLDSRPASITLTADRRPVVAEEEHAGPASSSASRPPLAHLRPPAPPLLPRSPTSSVPTEQRLRRPPLLSLSRVEQDDGPSSGGSSRASVTSMACAPGTPNSTSPSPRQRADSSSASPSPSMQQIPQIPQTQQTVVYARRRSPQNSTSTSMLIPPPVSTSATTTPVATAGVAGHERHLDQGQGQGQGVAGRSDSDDSTVLAACDHIDALPSPTAGARHDLFHTAADLPSYDLKVANASAAEPAPAPELLPPLPELNGVASGVPAAVATDLCSAAGTVTAEERGAAKAEADSVRATAEAEALRARLAALKLERQQREMKRVRTAVFRPPPSQSMGARNGGRSDAVKPGGEGSSVASAGKATLGKKQLETVVFERRAAEGVEAEGGEGEGDGDGSPSVRTRAGEIEQRVQRLERTKQLLQKYSMPNLKMPQTPTPTSTPPTTGR